MQEILTTMTFIERNQTDPYFNIAAEEYLLKNTKGDILMFWQSEPSVVVGKHQNILKEVNLDYVHQHKIPVIRRISGGGTVYHDKGNINYTLIQESERRDTLIDFRKFTLPVIEFLKSFGINARFEGKNNLTIGGKKFSGNSAHVFKNRIIHHGTFLFDSDLEVLEKIINYQTNGIDDKAIDSIRVIVTNVSPFLAPPISMEEFLVKMKHFFTGYFNVENIRPLTENEALEIKKLAEDKYKTWKWNYGYSPKYRFQRNLSIAGGLLEVEITTKGGIIEEARIVLNGNRLKDQENSILGKIHDKDTLVHYLDKKIPAGAFFPVSAHDRDNTSFT